MRHVPFEFFAVDPDVLRKVPANAGLLGGMPECLDGTDRPDAIPWRVGDAWLVFPAFLPDSLRKDHVGTMARWLEAARDA